MRGGKGMILMSGDLLSPSRVKLIAFLVLTSPLFWLFGQEPASSKLSTPDVATMPGMRALVPNLVAMGWENFFLDLRQNLDLSSEQSRQLYFIRQKYLANQDDIEKELTQAQLRLYRDLEEDAVSSSRLESDLKKIAELKAVISALHFKAALQAINVLDHRQHLRAEELLKPPLEMWRQMPSKHEVRSITVSGTLRARVVGRPKWPSSFTPQELRWKGW